MEEIRNEEEMVVEEVEEIVEESKLKRFGSKAKNLAKKYGKPIGVAALAGVGLVAGYMLGNRSGDEEEDYISDTNEEPTLIEMNPEDSE